jgi:type II secretory pathway pseudopilin PulG
MLVIIILILILIIVYFKSKSKREHLTNDEAIQNITSLYNQQIMTVTNLNVTNSANIGNIRAIDISANTLNLNNKFTVDNSGNINANNLIIDVSGKLLTKNNTNTKNIGIRIFYYKAPNKGESDAHYAEKKTFITDDKNNQYNANEWELFISNEYHDGGTYNRYDPNGIVLHIIDGKWALGIGPGIGGNSYGVRVLAIPNKLIDYSFRE